MTILPGSISPYRGKKVFLAQPPYDLFDRWDQLARHLDQYGIEVVPKCEYSFYGRDFAALAAADLDGADLFVQLLSDIVGPRPPDVPRGFSRLQFDLAKSKGVPILQWRYPHLDISQVSDPDHRALLDGPDMLVIPFEDFKQSIIASLSRRPVIHPPVIAEPPSFIFLDADDPDIMFARLLQDELAKSDFASQIPYALDTDNAAELQADIEGAMLDCDSLMVIYRDTSPVWVRAQLRLYAKLRPRRSSPVRNLALLFAGDGPEIDLGTPEIKRIDARAGFTPETINNIVSVLRG